MLTKGVLLEYISDLWSEVTILEGRIAKLEDSAKPKAEKEPKAEKDPKAEKKPKAEKEKKKPGRPKGSTKEK